MNIKKLIESIGLTAEEMKLYLIDEIEEFLEAKDPVHQLEEFHDIIFALKNIVFAHTGKHLVVKNEIYEKKNDDWLNNESCT